MTISANPDLSSNDKRTLNALFDPETLPSSVAKLKDAAVISQSLPLHPAIPADQMSALEAKQNDLVHRVSSTPDITVIDEAMEEMDAMITTWPKYPSAHLNRAMLLRLRLETYHNGKIFDSDPKQIEALFTSLSRSIHLSSPSSPTLPVSRYQARILRTAYSHRAYLYLKASEVGTMLNGKGKGELEELASGDFAAAARFGDEVAREMSVRTNPYAKMCGAIVRDALRQERERAEKYD
ncbi:hypothetical protein CC78DRAFT_529555 [Lojkania enalia]|uniref:Uncharacterized protein n=1 Tax=Lojkania enalia TaxID=147567 RepID=A0A9P4N3U9_9PLEO|nr:hypothetical protein CC78DRAFT_529555 [Didymosphaeria enalia]